MAKMKVLYLTVPSFFDLEISLIQELKKLVDIKVLMIVSPASMHSSGFSIDKMEKECAIIPATEYQGLNKYKEMIDLNDWYIANNPDNSFVHCLSLSCKIHEFYKKNNFTFFHSTTDCKTAIMFIPFAWLIKNTLFTEHDPVPHKKLSFLNEFLRYKLMFRSHKNILLLSKALLGPFLSRYNIDSKQIFFSRLSIYTFLQYYKEIPNDLGKYMLFFGNIAPYKGVDNLIEAYLQSEERKQGVKLVIAGKGYIMHDKSKLDQDIVLINRYIDNSELANLIRHCKYVVLPYTSATQSGCVMSAYAFSKPIIATKVGDLPKEVEDGITGLICAPNDIEDLQKTIDKMGKINLKKMSQNIAFKYAIGGTCSWTTAAQSIVNAYKEISK